MPLHQTIAVLEDTPWDKLVSLASYTAWRPHKETQNYRAAWDRPVSYVWGEKSHAENTRYEIGGRERYSKARGRSIGASLLLCI